MVIDEAHRLRNPLTLPHKVLPTETPLQNSLLELFGLVSFIDEKVFGDLDSFRSQFGQLKDAASFDTLKSRIAPICKRTLRRQVEAYVKYTRRIPILQDRARRINTLPETREPKRQGGVKLHGGELLRTATWRPPYLPVTYWKRGFQAAFSFAQLSSPLPSPLSPQSAWSSHVEAAPRMQQERSVGEHVRRWRSPVAAIAMFLACWQGNWPKVGQAASMTPSHDPFTRTRKRFGQWRFVLANHLVFAGVRPWPARHFSVTVTKTSSTATSSCRCCRAYASYATACSSTSRASRSATSLIRRSSRRSPRRAPPYCSSARIS